MAPVARFIPNKRRDEMSNFFIHNIQKIIKQREEQPPDQVSLTNLLLFWRQEKPSMFLFCSGAETSFS